MVISIIDPHSRKIVGINSNFSSLIWTERFLNYGDFELTCPITKRNISMFKMDYFISIPTSNNLMIIEDIEFNWSENSYIKIKGRSLESLMDRRILYEFRNTEKIEHFGSFLEYLFNVSIISPANSSRKIPNVKFVYPKDPESIINKVGFATSVNRGSPIGQSVYTLLGTEYIGIRASFDQYSSQIIYELYEKRERTNIVFSDVYFNFEKSDYVETETDFATSVLVAGSGEGNERKMITVSKATIVKEETEEGETESVIFDYEGIDRREVFEDARDLQLQPSEKQSAYKERLKQRGISVLSEKRKKYAIDGKITNVGPYKLKTDYDLGDVVTIKDNIFEARVIITEVIQSWDSSSGYSIYPTFETLDISSSETEETFNIETEEINV